MFCCNLLRGFLLAFLRLLLLRRGETRMVSWPSSKYGIEFLHFVMQTGWLSLFLMVKRGTQWLMLFLVYNIWSDWGWSHAWPGVVFILPFFQIHTFPSYRTTVLIYKTTKWVRTTLILGLAGNYNDSVGSFPVEPSTYMRRPSQPFASLESPNT